MQVFDQQVAPAVTGAEQGLNIGKGVVIDLPSFGKELATSATAGPFALLRTGIGHPWYSFKFMWGCGGSPQLTPGVDYAIYGLNGKFTLRWDDAVSCCNLSISEVVERMGRECMLVDHRVAQLLCSRLCHDIAGPAGAVNTGLELIDEGAGDVADEALDLVRRSAQQVIARLSFLRIAFGSAGIGSATTVMEMKTLASEHLDGGLVALDWPLDGLPLLASKIAPPGGMLILNILLLGVDALPRGGTLEVRCADVSGALGLAITAKGQGAVLRPELREAMRLNADIATLSARSVPGYCVSQVASDLGVDIEISDGDEGEVRMAAILPGG